MRLSVSIDPELLKEAMRASGFHTERETIECALRVMIQAYHRRQVIYHAGTIPLTIDRKALRALRRRT